MDKVNKLILVLNVYPICMKRKNRTNRFYYMDEVLTCKFVLFIIYLSTYPLTKTNFKNINRYIESHKKYIIIKIDVLNFN